MPRERKKKPSKPVKDPQLKIPNIQAKTLNQQIYLDSFEEFPVTFGVGCAGVGKSYLACFSAAKWLAECRVKRVILVRPVVEAGESLGFLPGDIEEKLAPYIQPLQDALIDMIGLQKTRDYMKDEIISVVPLAYMRGRTLRDSFVILDEAQNTTVKQMKMFLTRMGHNSRFVVNGDMTQSDLRYDSDSGLNDAYHRLKYCKGVKFVEFNKTDICRHPIVQDIVEAYDLP